ncbi:MAG: circadian clock KaiB family protein [Bacteroidales bacterium]
MKEKKVKVKGPATKFELAMPESGRDKYILRLYITGTTNRSVLAITNLKKICEEYLDGRYELEVIDLYKMPSLAKDEQIIAAPTLIKKLPLPFRRIIGDMSNIEKVLLGLDLKKVAEIKAFQKFQHT